MFVKATLRMFFVAQVKMYVHKNTKKF